MAVAEFNIEDVIDPDFTSGLRSEVYLELFREGLIDGHAHQEIDRLKSELAASQARVKDLEAVIKPAATWFALFSRTDAATAKIANDLIDALQNQGQ